MYKQQDNISDNMAGDRAHMESLLTLYVDGELPFSEQPQLFAHLAESEESRRLLDSIMRFRRIIQDENLTVPPAADDAFLKRLARHKKARTLRLRSSGRSSMWHERSPLTLRGMVTVTAMVFLIGFLLPLSAPTPDYAASRWVYGEEELVEFPDYNGLWGLSSTLYVFYPGLTIEAVQGDESLPGESL